MDATNRFKVVEGIGEYRLLVACGFPQAVRDITAAITRVREQGLRKMLVVVTGRVTFDSPSVAERHAMVRDWSQASMGLVRIAMIVPPHFIDHEKFGVIAAANFGMTGNVFTTETEARAWLCEKG